MRFNSDGKFKIMQITDIQEIPDVSPDTIKLINAALEEEKDRHYKARQEVEKELEELRQREALAEQMGGADKVARQHGRGKMDARARLAALGL